jgi:glycosyltransferase involved in cell wall biosynthesis
MAHQERTIRVLHVYRTYFPDPPGGVQEAIRQICRATASFNVANTVFCLSPRPEPAVVDFEGFPVLRARSWWAPASCDLGGPGALRGFAKAAREHDVVHYHFPWPFADVLHLAAHAPARTVMTYHSDIVRQSVLGWLYSPVMWRMLAAMDRIVATSPAYVATSQILADKRIAAKVGVIPLGMEDRLPAGPSVPQEGEGRPYFLFVGVLRYYKGLSVLIDAARHVDAQIVIAGDGPGREELERQVDRLKCDNVTFAGAVSEEEKFRLLRGCRAFVLPSDRRSEAFGMSLLEAAMSGRPMVTTEIGTGTSYVNLHRKTGLVVPPGDAAALAAALNTLLHDDQLARDYGEQARARYRTHFSGAPLGAAYKALYDGLIAP